MAVSFNNLVDSATTISQNPRYPENNPELPRQILGRSIGGAHFVFERSAQPAKRIILRFQRLSDAQKTSLTTFIQTHVNYMEKTFTYTDPHSVAHASMRFIDFGNWFARDQTSNLWGISLTLEEDEEL